MPTVTVGVPTYNRASHLRAALAQLLKQTFSDFELLIVDDASGDSTPDVVASFADCRIRYHRNAVNLNIPGNLNRILELASGEFIVILHDHDHFAPQLLEKSVALLRRRPEVGFVHPGVACLDSDGRNYQELLADFPEVMPGGKLVREILTREDFSCPVSACGMVRRSAYESVGGRYDPTFGFLSDIDMWLRLAARFDVGYLREVLITCARRDADHVYAGVSWPLIRSAAAVHAANIDRYFSGDERQRLLAQWRRKRDRTYAMSLLAAAAQGDFGAFRTGRGIVAAESGSLLSAALRALNGVPAVDSLAIGLASGLNRLRKAASTLRSRRLSQREWQGRTPSAARRCGDDVA